MDKLVWSSSASGYLILSKLTDGNYKITVGFPKKVFPEQVFNFIIDNRDKGFLIKNFGDKGWGITNLQTADVTMAGEVVIEQPIAARENSSDPFSNMLANVVHDSTINRKEVVIEEPPKAENKIIVENKIVEPLKEDAKIISDNKASQPPKEEVKNIADNKVVVPSKEETKINNENKTEPVKETQPQIGTVNIPEADSLKNAALFSSITRTSKKRNKEGLQLVYVDQYNNHSDTIRVLMPPEKIEKKKNVDTSDNIISKNIIATLDSVKQASKPSVNPVVKEEVIKKDEPKFIEYKDSSTKAGNAATSKSVMINSDCKVSASEDDFLKVRKKMVAENSDDDMIRVAKKSFKSRCYTTEQVKNLSVLFLKDEGKYSFFETAYPFVSDSDVFHTLESQLTDNYYINRFKAMIHH